MYKIRPWITEKYYKKEIFHNYCKNGESLLFDFQDYNEQHLCNVKHPGIVPIIEKLIERKPKTIDWHCLSSNPYAIEILLKYKDKIDWESFNRNPAGVNILKRHPEKIVWEILAENTSPYAIELLDKFIEENYFLFLNTNKTNINWNIFWRVIIENPSAGRLIKKYKSYISWDYLCENPCPEAIELIKENPHKINWDHLSKNPAAIDILRKNPQKIDWYNFCYIETKEAIHMIEEKIKEKGEQYFMGLMFFHIPLMKNPAAIDLLEKNIECVDYEYLSRNPAAMNLLEKNKDNIDKWKALYLFTNPSIFIYDYEAMSASRSALREEIIRAALHPKRVAYYLSTGVVLDDIYAAFI